LEQQIAAQDGTIEQLKSQRAQTNAALGEQRVKLHSLQEQTKQLATQQQALDSELAEVVATSAATELTLAAKRAEQQRAEAQVVEAEAVLATAGEQLASLAEERLEHEREATRRKIEAAKSEERLVSLRDRLAQFERDQQLRDRTLVEHRAQLADATRRLAESELNLLRAEARVAELYLFKEQLLREQQTRQAERDEARRRRSEASATAQQTRTAAIKLGDSCHLKELKANEARHERATLADRLRDDYGIELAELELAEASAEELIQREAVEQELAELRRRLNQLGNVNLEALNELDELESRFAVLKAQHDDLHQAKRALEQIIEKINVDSRRLFSETLEQVKINFQALFRKLFGGGQADVLLEEGQDILDAGIEIIARPPGKEPRNISLLSGGEKTLTCVALLLSIFQYRPSPFCVLDEVDAALDEANIERFASVLRDFLTWTQFIVVTHSKKTMTCATTLYGVTMQESGVSKRVSVKFEDVSEDGEIRAA
jgi:chromosome segregation protein